MVMVTCSKGVAERTPVHPALSRVPFDLRLGTEESCFQDAHSLARKSSQNCGVNDICGLCGDVKGEPMEQTPGSQSSLVP